MPKTYVCPVFRVESLYINERSFPVGFTTDYRFSGHQHAKIT